MANMGIILPEPGYLWGLFELAHKNGILFILDETVTGFRVAPGGCQEYFGIKPDLSTFGKAMGCGFPVAAFAGRQEIMEALARGGVLHCGTQNAARAGLFAARASLLELTRNEGQVFAGLWSLAGKLCAGLRRLFQESGVEAVVQNLGPMLQIMFTGQPAIRDYREFCASVDRKKYQRFTLALFDEGIYMSPSAALHSVVTTAHSEEDVGITLEAVGKVLKNGKF